MRFFAYTGGPLADEKEAITEETGPAYSGGPSTQQASGLRRISLAEIVCPWPTQEALCPYMS